MVEIREKVNENKKCEWIEGDQNYCKTVWILPETIILDDEGKDHTNSPASKGMKPTENNQTIGLTASKGSSTQRGLPVTDAKITTPSKKPATPASKSSPIASKSSPPTPARLKKVHYQGQRLHQHQRQKKVHCQRVRILNQ